MLHVQKRKRLQVAEKFQAHVDKVQETIEDALQRLPAFDNGHDSEETKPSIQQTLARFDRKIRFRECFELKELFFQAKLGG